MTHLTSPFEIIHAISFCYFSCVLKTMKWNILSEICKTKLFHKSCSLSKVFRSFIAALRSLNICQFMIFSHQKQSKFFMANKLEVRRSSRNKFWKSSLEVLMGYTGKHSLDFDLNVKLVPCARKRQRFDGNFHSKNSYNIKTKHLTLVSSFRRFKPLVKCVNF